MVFLRSVEMDLHYFDTYYIVSSRVLPAVALFISVVIWVAYFLMRKHFHSKRLIWFHVVITSVFLILLGMGPVIYDLFYKSTAGLPTYYHSHWTFERYKNPLHFGDLVLISLLIIIVVQVLFALIFGIRYFRDLD